MSMPYAIYIYIYIGTIKFYITNVCKILLKDFLFWVSIILNIFLI